MKTYYNCLKEITANRLFKGLLEYGMFNHKLPPIFTSTPFYNYCIKNSVSFSKYRKDWIRYDNNRNNSLPRQLGIPNPFAYYYLCRSLYDNWATLLAYFKNVTNGQPYKISRNHIRRLKDTYRLFKMNYDNFQIDGPKEPTGIVSSKYVIKADISNCFSSIYTHSIPWALLGKSAAKALKPHSGHYTQIIDESLSNTTFGETHGILIGPVSSNLVSEIVLCQIDKTLFDKGYRFVRCIDDYKCFAETREKAESFIVDLRKELLRFDLSLNEKKTLIAEISAYNNQELNLRIHQLDYLIKYTSDSYKKIKYNQILVYFDALDRLCSELDNNLSVYLFAFKIISSKDLSDNASRFLINKSLQLAFNNPYLLFGLKEYVFDVFGITDEMQDFCNKLYACGIEEANYEKAVYALYFSVLSGTKIDATNPLCIFNNAKDGDDCLLKLFSWIYCKKFYKTAYDTYFYSFALSLSSDESELDRNWLFVFEVLNQKDLKNDWHLLKKAKISFIEKGAFKSKKSWRKVS